MANTAQGEAECCICHETTPRVRLVLYLPLNPTTGAVFYHTTRVYGAFTDLLVLRGRTTYFGSILDHRLLVLAALTEWIHKAMQINKLTK